VEVHCHGGAFVIRRILALMLSQGARHADPGEFTKRAFLNGRLDLAQAEAVLDLIVARTEKGADLALRQINGELSNWVGDLREELLDILAQVEAAIDFPEEEIELLDWAGLIAKVNDIRKKMTVISNTYEWSRLIREGAKVCICGRPNVGKSSLLNALLGEERVIVTAIPGTTRDVIEESLNLDGLPVILWDTAGIRDAGDEVERIGVNLSLHHIDKADAVIVVIDGSTSLTEEDSSFLTSLTDKRSVIVINKSDLEQRVGYDQLQRLIGAKNFVEVSATRGSGIQKLKRVLRKAILDTEVEPSFAITSLRHKTALLRGEQALAEAVLSLNQMQAPELIAVNLQQAKESLEAVIGSVGNEEILERIFSKFCIGK
jgi:tRNA modification GTPase